jgi:hypothetical protein
MLAKALNAATTFRVKCFAFAAWASNVRAAFAFIVVPSRGWNTQCGDALAAGEIERSKE